MPVTSVIFDVGRVLCTTGTRECPVERLFDDERALDAFLRDVATREWHFQHDAGRPFAETSAELAVLHPHHADMIAAWGPRFSEQIPGPMPGMVELVEALDAAGVPLFAITNSSASSSRPSAREAAMFDRFRDIVVSGDERLVEARSGDLPPRAAPVRGGGRGDDLRRRRCRQRRGRRGGRYPRAPLPRRRHVARRAQGTGTAGLIERWCRSQMRRRTWTTIGSGRSRRACGRAMRRIARIDRQRS
ncbi:HAD family hydrolase [Sphingomonas sp. MMS24-JH45]